MQLQTHSLHQRYCVIPQSVLKRIVNHPLCSNLYLTEIGYEDETVFHPFTKSKGSEYLLVYVSKGEGRYRVNKKVYPVTENDFFVLPVRFANGLESSSRNPWSIYWAYFSGAQAQKVVQHLVGKQYSPKKAKPLIGRIAQFNDILHHLELMENIENLVYANSRFYSFLCSFRLMVLSSRKHGSKDGVIQSIEYMRENINTMVTLEDLAEVAGLSVSHYCALFKQKTMQTPMQLYTSMKIQRACQLLQNRTQTIKSISYSLGFFDQYHFSKVFKQIMGVPPKSFRNHGGD
ncbi:helix-turn-helix domain-containing protein [Chryseolinea sp. H1M3-3]|uniref:AraC family transcriptional regulator n=1 Tax=Chryseolinea sp. H1M3-3 TaxID=3034144 RepID=UPI0023EC1819|nr:helix-turn-helix domain-containing protein [Chryseolinea sp. H1M3-3]